MKTKSTMIDLLWEFDKLSDSPIKKEFLEYARRGDFHDIRSTADVNPKFYLVRCIDHALPSMDDKDSAILMKIKEDVRLGIYNEPLQAHQQKALVEELNKNKEFTRSQKKLIAARAKIKFRGGKKDKTLHFYI